MEKYLVAAGNDELHVIDYSDGMRIVACPIGAQVRDFAIQGANVFLACGEKGVVVVSLSDPQKPVVIGRGDHLGCAVNAVVMGKCVYILSSTKHQLSVFVVDNPCSLPEKANCVLDDAFLSPLALEGPGDDPLDANVSVAFNEKYMAVKCLRRCFILNIADHLRPHCIASCKAPEEDDPVWPYDPVFSGIAGRDGCFYISYYEDAGYRGDKDDGFMLVKIGENEEVTHAYLLARVGISSVRCCGYLRNVGHCRW